MSRTGIEHGDARGPEGPERRPTREPAEAPPGYPGGEDFSDRSDTVFDDSPAARDAAADDGAEHDDGRGTAAPVDDAAPDGAADDRPRRGRRADSGRRYSVEDKLGALRRFKESGLSLTEYCRGAGLNTASFCKWRRRYQELGVDGLKDRPNPRNSGKARGAYSVTTPEEKRRAIEAYLKTDLPRSIFAKTWGLSLSTLAKWLRRYRDGGPKALERTPGSGRPTKPGLPEPVRREIVEVKRRFPDFGMRKVRDFLARFSGLRVSAGGVAATLRRAGVEPLPVPRRKPRREPQPPRRFERAKPGELWQSDITSFVIGRTRERVYLTVFLDDHSRYIVSFALNYHQRQELVIEAFRDASAKFGKPLEALTDQGRQYYAWRGRSDFQKLLQKEGVKHVVSRAHHPETLGKCERLWETIDRELWSRITPHDLAEARERLAHWIAFYNHFRPHQSLGGLVPADRFFGAENAVRRAIEATLAKNELRLALDEAPRKPVYLVGQIDGRTVALHGERGRIVVRTPDGATRELKTEELGIAREQGHARGEAGSEERRGGDGADGDRAAGRTERAEGATGDVEGATAAAVAGAGAVGRGDGGGAEPRADDRHGAARVLDGAADEDRDGGAAEPDAGQGVAAVAAGGGGDADGAPEAAEAARPAAGADGLDGRVVDGALPRDDAVEAGPRAGGAPDRSAEGDAWLGAYGVAGADRAGWCGEVGAPRGAATPEDAWNERSDPSKSSTRSSDDCAANYA